MLALRIKLGALLCWGGWHAEYRFRSPYGGHARCRRCGCWLVAVR